MALLNRFTGTAGRRLLLTEVLSQRIVQGDRDIAEGLVNRGALREWRRGEPLIRQGETGNSIIFLLVGRAEIVINGRAVATRMAGEHVGEMAYIDASARRSADVVALENVVGLEVEEPDLDAIASIYPALWRRLARELAARLRGRTVRPTNAFPRVLVLSSAESLATAKVVADSLSSPECDTTLWTDSTVFTPGIGTLESLTEAVARSDFGVVVGTPDDEIRSRGARRPALRDNVIFELGLCVGTLGRERSFLLRPPTPTLRTPSDYLGVTAIMFEAPGTTALHLSAACDTLRATIKQLGVR
jgi:predicted nucleotide-binding protein